MNMMLARLQNLHFDDETLDYFDKMNNVEEIASLLHEVLLIYLFL
jgi:hypothetical protein